MKIGGLQPVSLCDYPGRVAAVVFTQGCNFRCPYCHNRTLWPLHAHPRDLIPPAELLEKLRRRRGQLDAIVLSGGEPTLQPDLADFLCELRALGFGLKLDTNGSRPQVLERLLRLRLLDFVAMDVKAPPRKYETLAGVKVNLDAIAASMRMIVEAGVAHEFRTTVPPGLLDAADLQDIRAMLPPGSNWRLQTFRPPRKTLART